MIKGKRGGQRPEGNLSREWNPGPSVYVVHASSGEPLRRPRELYFKRKQSFFEEKLVISNSFSLFRVSG